MRWVLLLCAAAGIAGGVLYATRDRRPDTQKAAEAAHNALLVKDAAALLKLMAPEKVRTLGLTETSFSAF